LARGLLIRELAVAAPKSESRRFWNYEELLAKPPETNQSVELWDGEVEGAYVLHKRAEGGEAAASRSLTGFQVSFADLEPRGV